MPLINPRLINNQLPKKEIPEPHLDILQAWRDSIMNRTIFKQKETALHNHFIQKILIEVLGYQGFGGEQWTVAQEQTIGAGCVDVALGLFSHHDAHILAPFELKGAQTKDLDAIMPGRHKSPVQQAWEYAMDAAGAQWVLVSNYLEIRLYAIGYGRQTYEVWDLSQLTDPLEYSRLQWLLNAQQLLSGETRNILDRSQQLEKEITNQLYKEYKALRENVLANLKHNNPTIAPLELIHLAQKILDRILFIAFAEDCGLLPDKTLEQAFQYRDPYYPRPIWDNFKSIFRAIDQSSPTLKIPAYNGGLFAVDARLESLIVDDTICRAFKELGEYDFASEISVTVLGHIFEQSISDIEELQAEARGETSGTVSKRKQHGVVYTPDHITHLIVEQTLGAHLRAKFAALWDASADKRKKDGTWLKKGEPELQFWRDYQQVLRTVRVVDPACGSGAFLVAAFEYLYDEYRRVNDKLADLAGGSYDMFDLDKEILNRNLYGVDVNTESIEITKLSLWLKTAKVGKVLNSLDDNIQVGNSLINDPIYTDKPFDWAQFSANAHAKNQDLFTAPVDDKGFDVVLGNPPYVRMEYLKPIKPYLEKNYQVAADRADLYAYFFELGFNILKPGGRMGYISSSTFFKTGSGENLRRFLMENVSLENILDFGDLQIFEGVTTYPVILTLCKAVPQAEHTFKMLILKQQVSADLNKYFLKYASVMPQADLELGAWRLEDKIMLALRQKITANKPTLKAVYGSPLYGIKTGLNEAFIIDRATRDALIKEDAKSEELLKPFLEGKDLNKWYATTQDLWIIYIPKSQINIEDYPAIKKYLLLFKEKLERRATKQEWFELQQAQLAYKKFFEMPKIIYPDISQGSKFYFDSSGKYFGNTVYFINTENTFLVGLLNSSLIWLYLKGVCEALRGGEWRLRLFNINIETIPIPNATEDQKHTIAQLAEQCQTIAETRYQKQAAVRRRIPDLCPADRAAKLNTQLKNWWQLSFAEFRQAIKKVFKQDIPLQERNEWEVWLKQERAAIEQLDKALAELEQQLNAKIYELFELNEAEIKLIEGNQ